MVRPHRGPTIAVFFWMLERAATGLLHRCTTSLPGARLRRHDCRSLRQASGVVAADLRTMRATLALALAASAAALVPAPRPLRAPTRVSGFFDDLMDKLEGVDK